MHARCGQAVGIAALIAAAACSTWALGSAADARAQPIAVAATAPHPGDTNLLGSGVVSGTSQGGVVLRATTHFIHRAAEDNAAEMIAAQYAVANSRDAMVRKLARHILAMRSKANDQILDLASRLGATMPTYPTSNQLLALNALRVKKGPTFDRAYAQFMANEHTQELERYVRAAQSARIAPAVRRYAQASLPMMQDTLQRANRLFASMAEHSRTG